MKSFVQLLFTLSESSPINEMVCVRLFLKSNTLLVIYLDSIDPHYFECRYYVSYLYFLCSSLIFAFELLRK